MATALPSHSSEEELKDDAHKNEKGTFIGNRRAHGRNWPSVGPGLREGGSAGGSERGTSAGSSQMSPGSGTAQRGSETRGEGAADHKDKQPKRSPDETRAR